MITFQASESTMSGYYVLDGHTPKPVTMDEWARMFSTKDRRVAQDRIGDVRISTVFLGLDHRFGDVGPPLIFETMIFGGEHDQWQERCSTWAQAEALHERALSLVRKTIQ